MMPSYKNGRIPKNKLIRRGTSHYATAGTWAKWDALVDDVKKNEGVTLRITAGNNAYRDYASQVAAKKKHGKNAAYPGTSSHGGVFKGKDAMAIDVANWGDIGQTKFYRYARKHGFEPGYFDWEPWHIIDWEPWRTVSPPKPKPTPKPEPLEFWETPYGRNTREKDMLAVKIIDGEGKLGPKGKARTYTVGSGFFLETTDQPSANAASIIINGYTATGAVAAAPNLTYAELYAYAKASHALTEEELAPYKYAAGSK